MTTDLIIGSAPPERAGAASAISETGAEFGGALGIAIFGSIGVAVYRMTMIDGLPPAVPAGASAAAAATLGGAVEVAARLSGDASQSLMASAREAFVRGLRLCAWISATGSVLLAIFALVMLRRVSSKPGGEEEKSTRAEPAAAAA